jgi:hypothetical protein
LAIKRKFTNDAKQMKILLDKLHEKKPAKLRRDSSAQQLSDLYLTSVNQADEKSAEGTSKD